ncbi:MAG: hypothetical protein RL416_572, partial [Pseudomonadota bacterium]
SDHLVLGLPQFVVDKVVNYKSTTLNGSVVLNDY